MNVAAVVDVYGDVRKCLAGTQAARRAHNDIVRAALSANYGSEIKHP